jgi:uncharacterized membrane protein (DUF485 family)
VSQQEMQFENTPHSETKTYDNGYEAFPHYNNDDESIPFSQKIGWQGEQNTPENAHLREHRLNLRIGMAITSLALWMIFFFIGLAIILNNPNNPTASIIQPFIIMGLGVFTVLIILANILINRKKV